MACYMIAAIEIDDREVYYRDYTIPNFPMLQRAGAKILVVDDNAKLVEGEMPAGRIVVLEFEDRAAAESWYHSDEYQAMTRIRRSCSTEKFVLFTDGVTQNVAPHDSLDELRTD